MKSEDRQHGLCPACGRPGHLLVAVSTHEHYVCPSCGTCYSVTIAELTSGVLELEESGTELVESTRQPATTSQAPRPRAARRAGSLPHAAARGTAAQPMSFKSAPRRASRAPHGPER